MTDFFSLLSLVLIFLAITIPARAPMPQDAVPVLVGRTAIQNQEVAVDPRFAYLFVESTADHLRIDILKGSRPLGHSLSIGLNEEQLEGSARLILEWLEEATSPSRVIYILPPDKGDPRVQRQAIRLLDIVRATYPTSIVLSSNDPP